MNRGVNEKGAAALWAFRSDDFCQAFYGNQVPLVTARERVGPIVRSSPVKNGCGRDTRKICLYRLLNRQASVTLAIKAERVGERAVRVFYLQCYCLPDSDRPPGFPGDQHSRRILIIVRGL